MRWVVLKMWAPIVRISRAYQFRAGPLRPPVAAQVKRAALTAAADRMLIADARRRYGKRAEHRARYQIKAGRYR
jgi:hypothetical protein